MKNREVRLTAKEEEVMNQFWAEGPLFVRELVELCDEPRPHFNTLSTIVRGLEEKGFLSHKSYGKTHQYFAVISSAEFHNLTLKGVIDKYYNNSIFSAVSALVQQKGLSKSELQELLDLVEKGEE